MDCCSNVAVPEATELAMRYYATGNLLWMLGWMITWAILALFILTSFSSYLEKKTQAPHRPWIVASILYFVAFFMIYALLNFPFDLYMEYIRPHQYDVTKQTFFSWLTLYGVSSLIDLCLYVPLALLFYWIVLKSAKRWWIYNSLLVIASIIFIQLVQPIWIDPLLNDYYPLKNGELKEKIEQLATKAGIQNATILEVDKSKETNLENAYVIGFGSSHRIVLWDTIVNNMPQEELLVVVAHEMGHYVLHHILWGIALSAIGIFITLYLTYKISSRWVLHYGKRYGISNLRSVSSLPLIMLVSVILSFLSLPLTNWMSRCMEHQADRFALDLTHSNEAAAKAFVHLGAYNLVNPDPGPIFMMMRATHPSLKQRIEFCNHYCPWCHEDHKGEKA